MSEQLTVEEIRWLKELVRKETQLVTVTPEHRRRAMEVVRERLLKPTSLDDCFTHSVKALIELEAHSLASRPA